MSKASFATHCASPQRVMMPPLLSSQLPCSSLVGTTLLVGAASSPLAARRYASISTHPSTSKSQVSCLGPSSTQRRPSTPQFCNLSTFKRRRASGPSCTTCQVAEQSSSSTSSSSSSLSSCSPAMAAAPPIHMLSSLSTSPNCMSNALMRFECVTRTQLSSSSSSKSLLHKVLSLASSCSSVSGSSLHHFCAQSLVSTWRPVSGGGAEEEAKWAAARSAMLPPTPAPRQSRSKTKRKRSLASLSKVIDPQPSSSGNASCAVCNARRRGEQ
mmetsp:Transcript_56623/g.143365  ORF Transcript_56623/g.143365 Transcript_56623/m.143365 type:complete len:270 (-) Transcript_56623:923-1732(-)